MSLRRYARWAQFLRRNREKKFRSARDFCLKVKVGISYPQYSRYESGTQLPPLDLALDLMSRLEIPIVVGLLEWNLAQIVEQNPRYLELAELLSNGEAARLSDAKVQVRSAKDVYSSLDHVLVLNRKHRDLLAADPNYRDVLTYVQSYKPELVPFAKVASETGLSLARVREMCQKLAENHLLEVVGEEARGVKHALYFPEDEDFFLLKNQSFTHNVSKLLGQITVDDLRNKKATRMLVTAALSEEDFRDVQRSLEGTIESVLARKRPGATLDAPVYSVCVLTGRRFESAYRVGGVRNAVSTGLRTQLGPSIQHQQSKG